MVETSSPAKSPPVTGKVPADSGTIFFLARLPAMASTGIIMKKRPRSCAVAVVVLYHMVFALIPPNAEPLLPVEETYAYRTCDNPCGPGLVIPAVPYGLTTEIAEKMRIVQVKIRTASMAILTS